MEEDGSQHRGDSPTLLREAYEFFKVPHIRLVKGLIGQQLRDLHMLIFLNILTSLTAPPLPRFWARVRTLIWCTPSFFTYLSATWNIPQQIQSQSQHKIQNISSWSTILTAQSFRIRTGWKQLCLHVQPKTLKFHNDRVLKCDNIIVLQTVLFEPAIYTAAVRMCAKFQIARIEMFEVLHSPILASLI